MPKTKSKDTILPSELRVLNLISSNKVIKEAAIILNIAKVTAQTEIKNARKRNKLTNVATLTRFAFKQGYFKVCEVMATMPPGHMGF